MCDCAICHDEITTMTGSTTLGCSHSFHLSCIVAWFVKQPGQSTCPYCRHTVGDLDNIPMSIAEGEDEYITDDDDEENEDTGMRPRFAHLLDDPNVNVYVDYDSDEELSEEEFEWDAAGVQKTHWTRDASTGIWSRTLAPQTVNLWNPSERSEVPITLYYHVREIQRAWRGFKARQDTNDLRTAHILLMLSN